MLAKVANWRELLNGNIVERRQVLREVLDGPIYFKLEGNAYRFTGTDRRGHLITDLVGGSTFSGVPTGIRPPLRAGFQPGVGRRVAAGAHREGVFTELPMANPPMEPM